MLPSRLKKATNITTFPVVNEMFLNARRSTTGCSADEQSTITKREKGEHRDGRQDEGYEVGVEPVLPLPLVHHDLERSHQTVSRAIPQTSTFSPLDA